MKGAVANILTFNMNVCQTLAWSPQTTLREHTQTTSAKSLGFLTPSPPCPHLVMIYSTKCMQLPIYYVCFGLPPSPSGADVLYVWSLCWSRALLLHLSNNTSTLLKQGVPSSSGPGWTLTWILVFHHIAWLPSPSAWYPPAHPELRRLRNIIRI